MSNSPRKTWAQELKDKLTLLGWGGAEREPHTEPDGVKHADAHPRFARNELPPILWRASEKSRAVACIQRVVYVWAENMVLKYGTQKPKDAVTIAIFFNDQMTFSIFGDAQNEDEYIREIEEWDREHKTVVEEDREVAEEEGCPIPLRRSTPERDGDCGTSGGRISTDEERTDEITPEPSGEEAR